MPLPVRFRVSVDTCVDWVHRSVREGKRKERRKEGSTGGGVGGVLTDTAAAVLLVICRPFSPNQQSLDAVFKTNALRTQS